MPWIWTSASNDLVNDQAAEILNGAAGWLVGIGSAWPPARALARRYISLLVEPCASIAAATTAKLRILVVIVLLKIGS